MIMVDQVDAAIMAEMRGWIADAFADLYEMYEVSESHVSGWPEAQVLRLINSAYQGGVAAFIRDQEGNAP